jgi:hypothetical protein
MKARRIGPREPHYLGYSDEQGRTRIIRLGPGPLLYELLLPVLAGNNAKRIDGGNAAASKQSLCLAILADYLNDDGVARSLYHPFTEKVTGKLCSDRHWRLLFRDIDAALNELKPEAA